MQKTPVNMNKKMVRRASALLIGIVFLGAALYTIVTYKRGNFEGQAWADTIFVNGDVITINPKQPLAQAVAIKGDRILAVGSAQALALLVGPNTQRIDLQGAALLPGFIEPHTHPVASAMLADWVDVSGFTNPTPEALFKRLEDAVAEAAPGEWVMAFGLDTILTQGLIPPNRHKLDSIAPNNPLFILSQVMHTAYVNTQALEVSNLSLNSPDPAGGHFERDASGEATGILHEDALKAISISGDIGLLGRVMQALDARQAFIRQYDRYAQAGYTTIGIPGPIALFPGYLQLLEHVASRSDSPIRSFVYPMAGEIEKTDYYPGYRNGRYEVLGVKIYLDGSPWTGGMATAEPYLQNDFSRDIIKMPENNRGLLKHSREAFRQLVDKYHNDGWQVAVHAHGERAHDLALDTIEKVQRVSPVNNRRHRLEHLGLITRENLVRAAKLGITPSFFIDHIYYFGAVIKNRLLGEERAERFMPLAWANEVHDRVSIHTDNPATPLDPMRALRTAVTRIPRFAQQPINTAQQMSVINALEAITIDAAWQLHAEDELGSIEVGKQADFTLLSTNPLEVNPVQWNTIKPLATWIAGQRVALD